LACLNFEKGTLCKEKGEGKKNTNHDLNKYDKRPEINQNVNHRKAENARYEKYNRVTKAT
jgi:hypothetical protein